MSGWVSPFAVRPNLGGITSQTDAEIYPDNPLSLGGAQNYTFDAPLPFIFLSLLQVGDEILNDTSNQTTTVRSAIPRRAVPTPGSTTATWMVPAG